MRQHTSPHCQPNGNRRMYEKIPGSTISTLDHFGAAEEVEGSRCSAARISDACKAWGSQYFLVLQEGGNFWRALSRNNAAWYSTRESLRFSLDEFLVIIKTSLAFAKQIFGLRQENLWSPSKKSSVFLEKSLVFVIPLNRNRILQR